MAKVKGIKELNKALDSITDPKFRAKALRKAGKEVMKPTLTAAIQNAPTLKISDKNPDHAIAGELKNDIKMRTSINKGAFTKGGSVKKNSHELTVSVTTSNKTKEYAQTVEYGRNEFSVVRTEAFGRQTRAFNAQVPRVNPQPFMKPALDLIEDTAANDFGRILFDEIKTQLSKQNKGK